MRLILRRGLAALLLLLASPLQAGLASHTSFKGEVTAYTYDALGREVTRTFADGRQVRTTYTATGQVATVTDARGTTTYAHDARDRVIRIDTPDGQWVAYAWDGNGNRTALTTPTGTTTYAYDDSNRLVQVTDPAGAVTTYAWDEAGNPTEQTLPNGVSTIRAYDDNGQLEEVRHEKGGTLLAKFSYERDEDGRRTAATEQQRDPATGTLHTRTLAWSYDALGRLASETLAEAGHTTTTAWTHDEVGNRLSEARNRDGVLLATDRYAYDANDRLTRAWTENGAGGTTGETLYTYDANGATTEVVRTGGFSRTYAYDAAQRLVGVSDSTGQRISYGYDAQGNRVTQAVQSAPDLAQNGSWRYLLDPLAPFTEVVATLSDTGQAEAEYRFGAGRIAELTAGQLRYYGEDGHHSVRLVTDAQGNVVAHLNYAAFGQAEGSVTDDASGNPAASPAFRYTGQQWDGALGEYYLRARTYDPGVGRFTQRDSWQGNALRPVTLNAYLYADADPVGGWDPSGHQSLMEQLQNTELQARQVLSSSSSSIHAVRRVSSKSCGIAVQLARPFNELSGRLLRGTGFQAHHVLKNADMQAYANKMGLMYNRMTALAVPLFGGTHIPGSSHSAVTVFQAKNRLSDPTFNQILAQAYRGLIIAGCKPSDATELVDMARNAVSLEKIGVPL